MINVVGTIGLIDMIVCENFFRLQRPLLLPCRYLAVEPSALVPDPFDAVEYDRNQHDQHCWETSMEAAKLSGRQSLSSIIPLRRAAEAMTIVVRSGVVGACPEEDEEQAEAAHCTMGIAFCINW